MSVIVLNWMAMFVSFTVSWWVENIVLKLTNLLFALLNLAFVLNHYGLLK
jgi:hypothetical protein